jgi:hypothetical protein
VLNRGRKPRPLPSSAPRKAYVICGFGEVAQLDVQVANGKVELYRAKVKVSFKYDEGSQGAAIRSAAQANA